MLFISNNVTIPPGEIDIRAIRASGPGGQHVNKTSSAAHLFFDIAQSSLPDSYKRRLLAMSDQRITRNGVIILKAAGSRSLEDNRAAALARLAEIIRAAGRTRKARKPTRPTRGAQVRRMDSKTKDGRKKALRGRILPD